MIEIEYVGAIRGDLGLDDEQEQLDWTPEITDVAALIDLLCEQRGEQWAAILKQEKLLISVNQKMVKPGHPLTDGDKIGFYPPIAGG
jgi:molybdopterin converting factor small subunit